MQAYAQIRGPEAARSASCARSGAGSTCRPAGATACAACARELAVEPIKGNATIVQDELQNTYQLCKSTRRPGPRKRRAREPRGRDDAWSRRTRPARSRTRAPSRARRSARGSVKLVGALADARFTGTFRLLFKTRIDLRHGHAAVHDQRATRSTSAAPRASPAAPAPTAASRAATLAGPRHQHARRPERRGLGRGLRDLLARASGAAAPARTVPLSAQACSSTLRAAARAPAPRPWSGRGPVRLSTRLSASSGSLSRS